MSANRDNPDTVNPAEQEIIYAEQVRLLYQALPLSLIAVFSISLIVAFVQWTAIEPEKVLLWLAIIITVTTLRLGLYFAFREATPDDSSTRLWSRRFFVGALFSGISWGLASWLIFPPDNVVHQVFLAMALAGISAGAVTSLSAQFPTALAFLIPTLLPLISRFFTGGAIIDLAMGILTTLFLIMIVINTNRSHKTISESLRLRFAHSQTEAALQESAEHNRLILESAAEGIFGVDMNGTTTFVNPAAARMLGYEVDELIGQPVHKTIQHSTIDGNHYPEQRSPMYASIRNGITQHKDDEVLWRKDGSFFSVDYISTPIIKEGTIQGAVVTFRDITERKMADAQIEHKTYYDGLTNLPNRLLLKDRLRQNLARCKHHGHYGALLFLDLDRFKTINDSLGHKIGDALLKTVAKRLTSELCTEDSVAHLGGDEFVILLSELSDDPETAKTRVQGYAEKVRTILSQPYAINERLLHATPSIGITLYPIGDADSETIFREADIAMYRAKEKGGNTVQFFLPSMQQAANERLIMENDLRQALEKHEMQLFFQPQIEAEGRLTGAEALLRWQHPERGMVSPWEFISLAEDTGLILPIGEWVLQTACRQVKTWNDEGIDCTQQTLAINVSPLQFRQKGFVHQVQSALDQNGIEPACIVLEVTENIVIANVENAIQKMHDLRDIGVALAIDDFGTGYSSLNYLRRLPLDKLKIDQSFIRNIVSSKKDAAIVETIISLAHHLGLDVIAEGIETEEELKLLKAMGCNTYQGYLFHRPQPLENFRKLLPLLHQRGESV